MGKSTNATVTKPSQVSGFKQGTDSSKLPRTADPLRKDRPQANILRKGKAPFARME